ncbi:hypothetical protein [Huintestinicola sp.]|uniref:hypothetical protein n=1 Tax=Huintestinicola sp. TaxID=2981661 RepID=UPI003D7C86CF
MKKKVTIAAGFLLAAAAVFLCIFGRVLYYRHYPHDRITGDITVMLNGQAVTLDESDFSYFGKGGFSAYDNGGSARVSVEGGEYGLYSFDIHIPGFAKTVTADIMMYNWWNVTDFKLDIAVDEALKTAEYKYFYTYIAEDGKKLPESGTDVQNIDTDELRVRLGG